MENPLLIVVIIALGILEDWGVVWVALIVVGLAGFVFLNRIIGGPTDEGPEWKNFIAVALGLIWAFMLFAFADWWWQMGYLY